MRNKDKKTPRTNANDYILSSDAEAILYGLILVLLSLIGLLSNGIIGKALTYIFAYIFGSFYIFVYIFMIFLGLYLMIKKAMFRLKIDLKILGFILIMMSFCIASSMGNNLTINNFFPMYQNNINEISSSVFVIDNTGDIFANLGGGLIGYFLNGVLNSTISETGTSIVIFIFLVLGSVLLFKNLFIRFVRFIKNYHQNRKLVREQAENERKTLKEMETRSVYLNSNVKEDNHDLNNNQTATINKEITISPQRVSASQILSQLNQDEDAINQKSNEDLSEFVNIRKVGETKENTPQNQQNTNNTILTEFVKEDSPIIQQQIKKEDNIVNDGKPTIEVITTNTEANNKIINQIDKSITKEDSIVNSSTKSITSNKIDIDDTVETNTDVNVNDTKKSLDNYRFPPIYLLKDRINVDETERKVALAEERLSKINECFHDLGIGANVISYTIGPSVTRFDVKVNPNVKTNVLCSIENDLAVRLGGNKTVRLETIVEGKNTSGIEVGNDICDVVSFKECMSAISTNIKDHLLFPLGKDISGNVISCKLDEMPHLLVCGTTGSGKSVFIHNIIISLIMRNKPDELKLMLIDPKRIEFTKYQDLPHLLCPVITSTDRGKVALMRLVDEMERRYDLFAEKGRGASNYKEYMETCEEMGYEKIPYIVMICDEFADFLADGDKEVPKLIQRIAQKARACGIYMVIATQRPSAKVITGEIKANVPSRIALSVSSQLESRIIIDEPGAENLMGKGDLLAKIPSHKSLLRVQSAYIDSKEIYQICEFIKKQADFVCNPNFEDLTLKVVSPFSNINNSDSFNPMVRDYHNDEKYDEIKRFVITTGKCSTTKLQNAFGIGFSRADGILDTLEMDGIITKEGNRRVLCDKYLNELEKDNIDE